jgi:hypothetical protein
VSSFAGSAFRALALGVLAFFLVQSGISTILRSAHWIGQAASLAGRDHAAVRRWVSGGPYVRAVEHIRRAIPRDGEYLLVRGGTEWEGGALWVRFDLAPRRARFLGVWGELAARELPPGPRWVVIAFSAPRPPVLMRREDFLRTLDRAHGGD